MKKYIFSLVCLCCALLPALEGQAHEYPNHPELRKSDANIVGHILDKNTKEHLPYITVALKGTTIGTVTDATGHYFLKNLPEGNFVLEVSSVGYKTVRRNVTLKKGRTLEEDFEIEEDAVALDGVVVSANRNETTRRLAPTLVNVVDLKIFENTNSTTLAQGLSFQPGVRVESNCQNCGFQQVRINGLDGPYTQILLDSRPIFSALSGVYGIEQIPASMIERVEVMRGGGEVVDGILTRTRYNAPGARVMGLTLEGKMAYLTKFQVQAGVTLQQSHYSEPHVWNKEAPAVKKMMRTPNTYGYFTATYTPIKPLSIALSGTYTGSMLVPHEPVPGFLEKPITVNTKDFFDIGLKAAYDFKLYKSMNLQVNAGVQNIFNAYQNDFDKGADRDSGYIYGPSLPRSFFAGVKISY